MSQTQIKPMSSPAPGASTPMPAAPPNLDFESPRIKAACRVLGLLPKDLAPLDSSSFVNESLTASNADLSQSRADLMEKKRRIHIHQVQALAEKSPKNTMQKSASWSGGSMEENSYLAAIKEREKASMQKMKERAKYDVQCCVVKELQAKKQMEIAQQKQAESLARFKALKKERDEQLKVRKKEAEKKAEKNHAVRLQAIAIMEREAERVKEEIAVKQEKVLKRVEEREQGWEENRVRGKEKRAAKAVQVVKLRDSEVRQREKDHEKLMASLEARIETLPERLSEMRALILSPENKAKYAEDLDWKQKIVDRALANGKRIKAEHQQELEVAYHKKDQCLNKVRANRSEMHHARAKELKAKGVKLAQKVANAQAKKLAFISEEIEARPCKSLEQVRSEQALRTLDSTQRLSEMKSMMYDVVQDNLTHNIRSRNYTVEQSLEKVDAMHQRVVALEKSKLECEKRRFDMMKNCAIEKMHLGDVVDKAKDAPPAKLMKLMEQLGIPMPGSKEDEEKEDEKK
eukprot:gnl/TRDRNA2_/TRDRNA2_153873_c0_seq1.p1 gnl/TRDRNA2_/TRDRNA2_153873_c0~~gnl/TRDRNA2_/TRDRNA2_153873_c0_seq1.p1  ORF type:complete len:517 (+),score=138.14 gnl/TRDRNA2_/TRDRNA2_153873_c0_seq1:108-1658(+)